MDKPLPRRAAAHPAQYNIAAIAKLEHDALDRRTPTERVRDVITKLVGNTARISAPHDLLSARNFVVLGICLPKHTVSLDRSALNIPGRNDFSGILLHAIPDGGIAIWRQSYRPKESNLRTPRTGPARQTQMRHKWDCG
jgi:hypothetical protein